VIKVPLNNKLLFALGFFFGMLSNFTLSTKPIGITSIFFTAQFLTNHSKKSSRQ
jgi:hypothetical protein